MILLDTDHVTCLKYPDHPRTQLLSNRLEALPSEERLAVSIITFEEQMRGWLAVIAKERHAQRQVLAYRELQRLFEYFHAFHVLAFDSACAAQFDQLRSAKLRIGTMDLKIAATAIANNATVLSANLQDFERVPGLRVENWLV